MCTNGYGGCFQIIQGAKQQRCEVVMVLSPGYSTLVQLLQVGLLGGLFREVDSIKILH